MDAHPDPADGPEYDYAALWAALPFSQRRDIASDAQFYCAGRHVRDRRWWMREELQKMLEKDRAASYLASQDP